MKYLLKNAQLGHVDDIYGYFRNGVRGGFTETTPNNDGTYTDLLYNRKFFGTGLYYMEKDPRNGNEIGFRLLHEDPTPVVFPIQDWSQGSARVINVTGTSVTECDLDGNETTVRYNKYVNEHYENGMELYYNEPGQEGYCEYKTYAEYIELAHPLQGFDTLTRVVHGVSYNQPDVFYNGETTRTTVMCMTNSGSTEIEVHTTFGGFCYFKPEDMQAWGEIARELNPQWNRCIIDCFGEDGRDLGTFQNGFFIPVGTKAIYLTYYFHWDDIK